MINPTGRDIDRKVYLLATGGAGRIVAFDDDHVHVSFDGSIYGVPFKREELGWACGKDRAA